MKVILSIGAPCSGHLPVFELVTQSGAISAQPCRDGQLSPQSLQSKLLRSMEVDLTGGTPLTQVNPGRLWNELAGDLFLTNIDHPLWGWADHQTASLMDFWREFDPQVRLLLVYNPPLAYLQSVMTGVESLTSESITSGLTSWMRWNTALLRYFHRHPAQCLLVNSQQALSEPKVLIELLKSKWQMGGLSTNAGVSPQTDDTALLAYLMSQLVDPHHPVWALNQELESVAPLALKMADSNSADPQAGLLAAWADCARTRSRVASMSQNLAQLGKEAEGQSKLLTERQAQIDTAHEAQAEQTKLAGERQATILALQAQRDSLALEKIKLIADRAELVKIRDQICTQKVAESKAKVDALAQRDVLAKEKTKLIDDNATLVKARDALIEQHEAKAKELAAQTEAVATANRQNAEIQKENDLLLLQLHQVQEELETYFLKNQALAPVAELADRLKSELATLHAQHEAVCAENADLAQQVSHYQSSLELATHRNQQVAVVQQQAENMLLQLHEVQLELENCVEHKLAIESQLHSKTNGFVADFWRMHQPAEVMIDMRREITGTNWYGAEDDGRWAGPELLSTLQMPPMQAGNYTLEFDIVEAMHLEIVTGMVVEVMGRAMPVEVVFPIYKGEYPVIAQVHVEVVSNLADQPWDIGLQFPKRVSPAMNGSSDTRHLAIRLRSLVIQRHEHN